MIRYESCVIAVKDVEISKRFYSELLDQRVTMDLGKNVSLEGGLALQEDFAWLTDVPADSIARRPHDMELYFEVDDFDDFCARLRRHPDVRLVHAPKEHAWKQRVVRIYDPDGHMIEVGESMAVIARRYLAQGLTAEETARIIQHPVSFVEACREDE